jgi:hypothetical protein
MYNDIRGMGVHNSSRGVADTARSAFLLQTKVGAIEELKGL